MLGLREEIPLSDVGSLGAASGRDLASYASAAGSVGLSLSFSSLTCWCLRFCHPADFAGPAF